MHSAASRGGRPRIALLGLGLAAAGLAGLVGCGGITPLGDDGGAGGKGGAAGAGAGGRGGSGSGGGGSGGGGSGSGGSGSGAGGSRDAGSDVRPDAVCICPANYAPVCGVDGKTYGNSCAAACAGVAIAYNGVCGDGGAVDGGVARGFCNVDSDCVFQATDGCCGSCLARGDRPIPPMSCAAVLCTLPPGGCSCVNHMCRRGILTEGNACNQQQDACGDGLLCCYPCNPALCDALPICRRPIPGPQGYLCPGF